MAKNKVSQYLGNLGKSVVFSAVDTLPSNMESGSSFINTNASLFKDIYAATKDYRKTFNKASKFVIDSKIYRAADVAWASTKESIRTGNFYSKEREEKYSLEAMGDTGDFSDMDIDFDNLDATINANKKDQSSEIDHLGNRLESSNYNSAEATCNMIANSTDYIVSNSRNNAKIMATQNARMMTLITKGFEGSNQAVNKISSVITGPMMAHMDNSKKAYEKLTTGVDAIVGILTEMNDRQKSMYESKNNNTSSNNDKIGLEDIISSSGAPDIKQYLKVIKNNTKKAMGPTGDMLFGDTFGEGSNLLLAFAANPLAFIPQYITKSLIPKSLERSMQNFDKTLSGFFSTFIAKMNKMSKDDEGGITSLIGRLLGVDNKFKTSIDTSSYKKGPIPFDGETKKAITEVIPTYLRNIEASINQTTNERIFDYNDGKWVKDSDIIRQAKNVKSQAVDSAFSDIIPELKEYLNRHSSDERYDYNKMQDSMMNMLSTIFDDYGSIEINNKKLKKDYMKYGVQSEEYFKILLGAMKSLPREMLTSMAGNVMSARSDTSRKMKNMEDNGGNILNHYFNGSIPMSKKAAVDDNKYVAPQNIISKAIDEKGNNIFFYLRNIASELHELRLNGMTSGRSNNKRKSTNSSSINTKWLDTTPDNNKARDAYERKEKNADERYITHIASLKKANGDKKLLTQYSTNMSIEEANIITGEMANEEYLRLWKQADADFKADSSFQRALEENAENNRNKKAASKGKGLINRLIDTRNIGEKIDVIKESASDLMQIPSKSIEKILNVADEKMYQLMFGYKDDNLVDRNGRPIQGFIGHLLYNLQNSFDKFNTFIDENILNPLKEKLGIETFGDLFNKIATKLGFDKDRRNNIKSSIKEKINPYTQAIKDSFSDVFNETKNAVIDTVSTIKQAGNTNEDDDGVKHGIGFTNDLLGLDRQEKNDQYFKNNFPDATEIEISKMVEKELKKKKNEQNYITKLFTGDAGSMQDRAKVRNQIIKENKESKKENTDDENEDDSVFTNAKGTRFVEKSGITTISKGELIVPSELNPFNRNAGKVKKQYEINNENNIKNNFINQLLKKGIKSRAKGSDNMSDMISPEFRAKLDDAKEYAPKAVGRGAVGAVAALLAGVNPLVGLLLGGVIGVAEQSSGFQDWIFGTKDENGDRTGGFVTKDLQDKFDRATRSDMKTLGLTGMVAGLIAPFGPVGGLIIGSALGFAKNNKAVSNYLFGELNEETGKRNEDGLISPKTQEFIKRAAPNLAIGTIAGIVAGPFGFLGNALLGSGLGLVSATDEFRTFLFGEEDDEGKRHGGALDKIKNGFLNFIDNYVFDPLKRFIKPVGQMIKNGISSIANGIKDGVNSMLEKTLGAPFSQWFKEHVMDPGGKFFGNIFKGIAGITKKVVAAPFSILGATGDMIRRKQINRGTANDMSADERLTFMKKHGGFFNKEGNYRLKKTDELISSQSNEDVTTIANLLGQTVEGNRHFSKQIIGRKKKLFSDVDKFIKTNKLSVSRKQRDMLIGLAESGKIRDLNQVSRILGKQGKKGMKPDQQRGLYDLLSGGATDISDITANRSNIKKSKKDVFKELRKLGIEDINSKNARRYYEMYNKESKFRGPNSDKKEKGPVDNISENTQKIIKLLKDLVDTNVYLASGGKDFGKIRDPKIRARLARKKNKDNDKKVNSDNTMNKGIKANIKRSNKRLENLKESDNTRLKQAGYSDTQISRMFRKHPKSYKLSDVETDEQIIGSEGHLTKKDHFMNRVERKAAKSGKDKVTMYNPIDNRFHSFIKDSKSGRMVPDNQGATESSNGIFGKANNLLDAVHNIGSGIKDFFGIESKKKKSTEEIEDEEYDNPVNKFFTKLLGGAPEVAKIAAKGFVVWNAAAIAGHGLQAFEDRVWPLMSDRLDKFTDFLDEKFNGLGTKFANVFDFITGGAVTGEHARPGKGLPNLIWDTTKYGLDWASGGMITGQFLGRGLPSLVFDRYLPWTLDGVGLLLEKTIGGLTKVFSVLAPYVIRGIGSAIKSIFTRDFWTNISNGLFGRKKLLPIEGADTADNDLKKLDNGFSNYVSSYYSSISGPRRSTIDKPFDTSKYMNFDWMPENASYYSDGSGNNDYSNSNDNGGTGIDFPKFNNNNNSNNNISINNIIPGGKANGDNNNGSSTEDVVPVYAAYEAGMISAFSSIHDNNSNNKKPNINKIDRGKINFINRRTSDGAPNGSFFSNNKYANNIYNRSQRELNNPNDRQYTEYDIDNENIFTSVDSNNREILIDKFGNVLAIKNSSGEYISEKDIDDDATTQVSRTLGGSLAEGIIRSKFNSKNPLARLLDFKNKPIYPGKGPFKVARSIVNLAGKIIDVPVTGVMNFGKKIFGKSAKKVAEEGMEQEFKSIAEQLAKAGFSNGAIKADRMTKSTIEQAKKAGFDAVERVGGKSAREAAERAGASAIKNATENLSKNTTLKEKAIKFVDDALNKLFKDKTISGKIISCIKESKRITKTAAKELLEKTQGKLIGRLLKSFGENASKKMSTIALKIGGVASGGFINLAFAVADFLSGMYNCESILGISSDHDVTFGMRIVTGLLKAVNGFILFGVIPEDILVSIFVEILAPILNIDMEKLNKERDETEKAIQEHNLEYPDDPVSNASELNAKNSWWAKAKKSIADALGWWGPKTNSNTDTNNSINTSNTTNKVLAGKGRDAITVANTTNKVLAGKGRRDKLRGFGRDDDNDKNKLKELVALRYTTNNLLSKNNNKNNNQEMSSVKKYNKLYNTYGNILKNNIKFLEKDTKITEKELRRPNITRRFKSIFTPSSSITKDSTKNIMFWTNKVLSFPLYMSKYMNDKISNMLKNKNISGTFRNFDSLLNYLERQSNISPSIISNFKNSNLSGAVKSYSAFGRSDKLSGGYSSQKNSSYSDMKYGNSTIAEEGCGPVAAANLLNDVDVKYTADYASQNGFVDPSGGTDINYFNSILSSRGIPNGQTTSVSDVKSILRNGGQAVLLGKDSSGGSDKAYSNQMHFITAKSMDSSGNIVIDDPDLGTRTMESNKVFNGMKASVLVGSPGKFSGFGKLKGSGKGNSTVDAAALIWNTLRSKGTSEAGAAGAIGVFENESALSPINLENGYERILGYNDKSYTKYVDTTGQWPERGKYGNDYYNGGKKELSSNVGYGLAQWTTKDRKNNLLNFAKSYHKSIGDLGMQINFAIQELANSGNSEYKKAWNRLKRTNNPEDAALGMLVDYEMPGWSDSKGKNHKFYPPRARSARKWYNKFKGTNPKSNYTSIDNTYGGIDSPDDIDTNNTTTISTPDNSKPSLFDNISDMGKSVLGAVWGKEKVDTIFGTSSSSSGEITYNGNEYDSTAISDKQNNLVQSLRNIQGTLKYSTDPNKQNPDIGYGSCASTVGWAYKKVFPEVFAQKIMSAYTPDQSQDSRFSDVFVSSKIDVAGNGSNDPNDINMNAFQPGDLLYFSNNKSHGRRYGIGHAEMYTGNNKIIGHGNKNKLGPNERTISNTGAGGVSKQKLVIGRRYLPFVNNSSKSGYGRSDTDDTLNASKYITNNPISNSNPYINNSKHITAVYGSSNMNKSDINTNNAYLSSDTYIRMMSVIVEVLCRIADNTDKLSEISKVLSNKLNINIPVATLSAAGKGRSTKQSSAANESIRKSIKTAMSNTVPTSNDIGTFKDKDTEYIVKAMKAIVTQ